MLTAQCEVGNLAGPLELRQVAGIWLVGDYRSVPADAGLFSAGGLTTVLIAVALLMALLGLVHLVRRRGLAPLLYVGVSALALVVVTRSGSPWADSKALAIAAPAVTLLAGLGVEAVVRRGRWPVAAIVGGGLAAGVLVSNAFAYHDSSLAPRDRMDELSAVGDRLDGKGPTLATMFEEYTKHFMRDAQPVTPSGNPAGGSG